MGGPNNMDIAVLRKLLVTGWSAKVFSVFHRSLFG